MRGFILFLEAILAFLVLVAFFTQFFIPSPNSFGIAAFLEKNDRLSAEMEAGVPASALPYVPGSGCMDVRYVTDVLGLSVIVRPVCVR